MKIYFNNTDIDLPVNDESYRYRAIKGEHSVTLYYSLTEHVEIPLGAYCVFEGVTYTLEKPENFKKHNTRNFEYTLILDSSQAKLSKYKFKDTTTRRLKFSLTAQPQEHLQMLVDNLNQRESGWTVGAYVSAVEKTISYNHAFCIDALSQMADEFDTEWEIVGKTINLRKVEYNKENPLPLSYGRGNGFKPGIGRANTGDSKPVEILYVQGGDRNIDASKYGSNELLLPKNQSLVYDGRTYISDEDGFSIHRADKPLVSYNEDSIDLSNIYPSRVGTISSVIEVDSAKNFYDFTDNSIPEDLDYTQYIIAGESLTVIFQSGMLAGKEFEVKYIHTERRFEIVPQEIDGRIMPEYPYQPLVGEKYAVFGMMMPEAYVCNNADKSGASWDMFREAAKYLYEHEDQKFTFTGELDGIWAKKDWLNIGGRIKLGGYVLFSDEQFQPDGVLIRIVGVKDYINNPHSPIIELSNTTVGATVRSDLRKIESNEVVVDDKFNKAYQYNKRSWRNAIETLEIMEGAMLKNFTESISPITVRTMAALIGDESLQFIFVDSKTDPHPVDHRITLDNDSKVLNAPAGIIQHMTLGIDNMAPTHAPGEYKFWDIPEFNSPPLDDAKKYYLYAKVSENGTTGVFYLSETAKAMDSEPGFYYLWVGFINSSYNGERTDFVNVNSFTEILPGQMTIDLIRDSLARLVIDLKNARIIAQNGAEIIGKITFQSGSAGYENLTDKPDLSPYDEAVDYLDNVLPESLEQLQAQIDGTIESWFYHYDPTMTNVPVSEWQTSDYERHLDDTFTNLDSGQSWRFTKDGNVYSWTLMADTAASQALIKAGQAQDTADGKRRVFVSTPYPPYDVGDLWTQGSTGDIMRCTTARQSGNYVAADWGKASKYTDDSTANSAYNRAGSALSAAEYASNAANAASLTASSAQSTADTAYSNANTAQATANSKCQVFYATSAPSSGMKTNDLWVNGTLIYRYNGSSWVNADKYDVQMTIVNGGLVSTGAIIFGQTGGMAATGSVRIWSGGSGNVAGSGTFRVMDTGDVYSRGSYFVENSNGTVTAGLTGAGTASNSVRIWAGSTLSNSGSAPFRVTQDGSMYSTSGEIGGFLISNSSIRSKENAYSYLSSNARFFMYSQGSDAFLGFSDTGLWAGIGLNVLPSTTASRALLRLENTATPDYASDIKYNTYMRTQGSSTRNIHILIERAGEFNTSGKNISIESRQFSNDSSGFFRTCLGLSTMPTYSQINTLGSSGTRYNVKWDSSSGYLYIE
jgi:hypothetical protein